MKKNLIWVFILIAVLLGVGVGALVKWQINKSNNNLKSLDIKSPETTVGNTLNTNNTTTDNKVSLYLIDGKIEKIYNVKPFKIDVRVNLYKFLPNQKEKEIIKTITTTDNTEFILHKLAENKDYIIDPSLFMKNDDVAIWIIEPNIQILKLEQLTATKIIKFE